MNNTPITISQELIDQLIKDEVQRQLESKVTDALTQENIQRSIRTFVNKTIDMTIVDKYINTVLEGQKTDPQSFLNTNITSRLERAINEWVINNKWSLEQSIKSSISSTIKSTETYTKFIEPLITKYIAEDPSFIPYAKNEINTKLNEKIKNFNKLVGDNISSQLVKEFLQGYLSNRFGDKPNE
jgi:hypothetical protein